MTSPSGGAYMGRGTNAPKRWQIPPDCRCPGTHLWCQWSHQSTVGVLLAILDRREVNVQLSDPQFQWGQIGDVICPMKAWYEAVDVSLLSLSWWIALCACRGTPGGILELSWPLQHLGCQLALPVSLLWAVFSNSSYHDCTVNCCKCWNADPMSISASDWFRRPPSFAASSVHSFPSTPANQQLVNVIMFNDLKVEISWLTLLLRWSITSQLPLYCGCRRKTSAGTLFLIFLQSNKCYYMLTIWQFCAPKFVDTEPGLLEVFENVSGIR